MVCCYRSRRGRTGVRASDHLTPGTKVAVRVLRIDADERKIGLTLVRGGAPLEGEGAAAPAATPAAAEPKAEPEAPPPPAAP